VRKLRGDAGFSLIELLVATGVLLIVSSIVTTALIQMSASQKTIWNRTEMHSGVRGATELLQQEVGQAGRIATPVTVTMIDAVTGGVQPSCDPASPATNAQPIRLSSSAGLWAVAGANPSYVMVSTMDGNNQETFRIATIDNTTTPYPTITACFTQTHLAGTVVMPLGGFATGIVPNTGVTNGSTASVLKLYGDINGDGNMVYVEYTCDTNAGKLYRNVMAYDTPVGSKPANSDSMVLLSNILPNPGGTPCFTYQTAQLSVPSAFAMGSSTIFTFVLDVAITLTVETEQIDPITRAKQTETKALLNVSPRNVFHAWSFGGMGYTDRIQSTPATVQALVCAGAAVTCP
jgi:prepilin-type N-terminal cleavage/methylation domain-containing protein